MTPIDADLIRLRAFVAAWRRLQPRAAPPFLHQLQAFVKAWGALPHDAPAKAAPAEASLALSTERLDRMLAELRPALDRARTSGSSVNVWRVAGLGRNERRLAEALAWLLQPRGDHGLGAASLEGLFDALHAVSPNCPRPSDSERTAVRIEHRPLWSNRDRVDLVLDHPELLLFVEIKIDAGEGRDQLRRYLESAEQAARSSGCPVWRVAYLTRAIPVEIEIGIIPLTWRDLSRHLQARIRGRATAPHASAMIQQLLDHFASL